MATRQYTLSDMLQTHEKYRRVTPLRQCFGDGYLYAHNEIFRNVREGYLSLGGKFTFEDFCHAKAFPVLCLPAFLNSRKVVVFDNVTPMQHFASAPFRLPFELFQKGANSYIKNDLFHDPFHYIVYRALFNGSPFSEALPKTEDTVLRVLMSEALTHAAEALISTYADSEAHHLILNFNVHQRVDRLEQRWRLSLRLKWGAPLFFRAYFFASLFGQFAYLLESDEQLKRLFVKTRLPKRLGTDLPSLRRVFASQMSPTTLNYKIYDSELFFRMLGFKKNILELLSFDFIDLFWKTADLPKALGILEKSLLHTRARTKGAPAVPQPQVN